MITNKKCVGCSFSGPPKKTIADLKAELEMDQDIYLNVVQTSTNEVSRHVCYGKLDIIKKVLDFLNDNNIK